MIQVVERAIRDSDLGVNPATSGDVIRIPMPAMTEERRRERVLTARYPDEVTHQAERESAIDQVEEVTVVAHKRVQSLKAERRRLDQELEFYRGDLTKAPVLLQRQVADNEQAQADQQRCHHLVRRPASPAKKQHQHRDGRSQGIDHVHDAGIAFDQAD